MTEKEYTIPGIRGWKKAKVGVHHSITRHGVTYNISSIARYCGAGCIGRGYRITTLNFPGHYPGHSFIHHDGTVSNHEDERYFIDTLENAAKIVQQVHKKAFGGKMKKSRGK